MTNIDRLLLKASLFEKAAIKKFAHLHNSMNYALSKLLNKNISQKDVDAWEEKNKPIFNTMVDMQYLPWATDYYKNQQAGGTFIRTSQWNSSTEENEYFYIGTSATQPNIVKLKESFILQGYGEIPTLWAFFGTECDPTQIVPNVDITKELAHEKWLIDALSTLFYRYNPNYRGQEFISEIKDFIIDNKDKINYFRTSFFKGNPKILGEPGADGVALAISDRLVLKLFTTRNAFIQTQKAVDRLHKYPELAKTEAMIYDIGEFGEFGGKPLYYYIIERMIPVESLGENIRDSLEDIKNYMRELITDNNRYWKTLKNLVGDPSKHAELKSLILRGVKKLVEESKRTNEIQIDAIESELGDRLNENWLESYAQELIVKELTDRRDLHMGNVGLTKYKDFRYFDPVYKAPYASHSS